MQLATLARRGTGILASVAVATGTLIAATPAHADDAAPGFVAQAYGSYAFTDDRRLGSGPTAYSDIACGAAPGEVVTNKTAQVVLPELLGNAGAQSTYVESIENGTSRTSLANSRTASLNLLGGLIRSGVIKSETRTTWNGSGFSAEGTSSLADLEILGLKVDANPAPNTRIDLSLPLLGDVGYVELNRQIQRPVDGGYEAITTAFHLVLLADNPWLPGKGLHVWLGNSKAALTAPSVGFLKGQGFASRVTLANGTVNSGATALAKVACTGGRDMNSAAAVDLPDIAKAGAAKTDAIGETTATEASSKVGQRITSIEALGGLIRADALVAAATATRSNGGPITLTDSGTRFVGLTVAGHPLATLGVAPNTKISLLDGAAEVTLRKVKRDARTIEVTMIEIVVKDGTLGLPIGSKVEIGRAYAGITPAS
jgi:hypothetical protein